MTTQSMTGFCQQIKKLEQGNLIIEIRSLNSRYLDVHLNLCELAKPLEMKIRQKLSSSFLRGKIDCNIYFKIKHQAQSMVIDELQLECLLLSIDKLTNKYKLSPLSLGDLLSINGVLTKNNDTPKDLNNIIINQLEYTIRQLIIQRKTEGNYLVDIIKQKLELIDQQTLKIQNNYILKSSELNQKLLDKISGLKDKFETDIDSYRLEQEAIYYLNKMDIEEEIERLNIHITQIKNILSCNQPKGRKIEFLLQEISREVNTIGSKSRSHEITIDVVEIKVLLEHIREQIQNIE